MEFTISFQDSDGNPVELRGEPEVLAKELEELGYDGPSIELHDEPGFVRGWVKAGQFRSA